MYRGPQSNSHGVLRPDAAWLTILIAQLLIFGFIIIYADFIPFVFDNNESFAAFWHARNMHAYGVASSSGLADEAFSYDVGAHPFVYTHSGASPRLFAYLLFVVGARTVESQIALTVLIVGTASFWLAYRFLAEVAGRLYATVACLLLMTDYLLFAQWHVVVWQTWKTLYLFGGLYLAHQVAMRRPSWSLFAIYAFHAALFYYETVFNVYVALVLFLYFAFLTRELGSTVKFGLAQFAGASTAAIVLLGQNIHQLGWQVVQADFYYTFVGRNFATNPEAFLRAAMDFYSQHNIVFWPNVPDTSQYRTLASAIRVLFQDHAIHTTPWSLVVLAFAAAELIRRTRHAYGFGNNPLARALGICTFFGLALASPLLQSYLYIPAQLPVWKAALGDFVGLATATSVFVVATLLLAAFRAFDAVPSERGWSACDRILLAIAALLTAFCITYVPFAGYIQSGYSARYAPFTIYFNSLLVALGLVAMIDSILEWSSAPREPDAWRRMAGRMRAGMMATGLVVMVMYWGNLQVFLFNRTPPDILGILPKLRDEPFRGKSFVALAHGGVLSYFTGKWAYLDFYSTLAQGRVTQDADGFHLALNKTAAWFADRSTNPAYDRPEYFLTMTYLGAGYANDLASARPKADDTPLVAMIREGRTRYLHPVEVARDPSPLDRWSIVRLDWDFPPFLRVPESGEPVRLDVQSTSDGIRVRVSYTYAHQEGKPEAATRVTVTTFGDCGGTPRGVTPTADRPNEFLLPAEFNGSVRAEVQPATATKIGPSYQSALVRIGAATDCGKSK